MEKWDEIHRFAGYKCYHLTIPLDMLFPHDVHFQLQGLKTISTWNFKSNRDQLCNWNKAWTSISKLSFVVFSCFSLPKRWTPTEFCCRSPKTRAPWQLPPLSGTWPTVPAALRTLRTADSCGCTQRRWSSMGRGRWWCCMEATGRTNLGWMMLLGRFRAQKNGELGTCEVSNHRTWLCLKI